jgi:lactate dehydrogenase-like 2-hydroxyacid dehydrogenase
MKIAIFLPKKNLDTQQAKNLEQFGDVVYTEKWEEYPINELIQFAKGAEYIGIDPDNFGGFEKAKERVTQLLETLPNLKGIALSTTSFGWVDLGYCKKRHIPVCNIPGYSREAVAEHTITLLLCMAKRILITDRRTQLEKYRLEQGFELKGKTLGIIGLGNIGSRTAELALGIGMKVIAYNRSPKKQKGVEMVSLDELLKKSDAIAFHVTHEDANERMIGKKEIQKMKKGVIIVNTADRGIIDEKALAEAIKSGTVDMYTYEAEDFIHTPLAGLERVIGLRGFGWNTRESIHNLFDIFIANMKALVSGKPQNVVNK